MRWVRQICFLAWLGVLGFSSSFPADLPAHVSCIWPLPMQGHTLVPAHACTSHRAQTHEVGQGVHRGAGRGRGPGWPSRLGL